MVIGSRQHGRMLWLVLWFLVVAVVTASGKEEDTTTTTTTAAEPPTSSSRVDEVCSESGATRTIPSSSPQDEAHSWMDDNKDAPFHQHDHNDHLQQVELPLNDFVAVQLLQHPFQFTSQQAVEHDVTGTVVWGASICLARHLLLLWEQQEQQQDSSRNFWQRHVGISPQQERTEDPEESIVSMELGCGMGLPSLALAVAEQQRKANTTANNPNNNNNNNNNTAATTTAPPTNSNLRILATDMEASTLQQLDRVAQLNQINKIHEDGNDDDQEDEASCRRPRQELELYQLDWKDSVAVKYDDDDETQTNETKPTSNPPQSLLPYADVLLGADIIYQDGMVDPLAQTVARYLQHNNSRARAYLALRPSREGVQRLITSALPQVGLELEQVISCRPYLWKMDDNGNGNDKKKTTRAGTNPKNHDDDDTGYLLGTLQLPVELTRDPAHLHRYQGNDAIYVFRRKQQQQQPETPP